MNLHHILAQEFYEASGLILSHAHDKPKVVAGLEATLPRIRKQIAADIRDQKMAGDTAHLYLQHNGALEIAARIAEKGDIE